MAVQLMTKAAYARHRGCDEKAVRKAIAENRISLIDGKIDPAVADIQWAQNTRARAGSGRPSGADELGEGSGAAQASSASMAPPSGSAADQPAAGGYQDHRVRREAAEAERAEIETAKLAGRVIDRDSTVKVVHDMFHRMRESMMAAAQRAATKVIGMNDPRDIEHVFADEVRKALQGLDVQFLELIPARQVA